MEYIFHLWFFFFAVVKTWELLNVLSHGSCNSEYWLQESWDAGMPINKPSSSGGRNCRGGLERDSLHATWVTLLVYPQNQALLFSWLLNKLWEKIKYFNNTRYNVSFMKDDQKYMWWGWHCGIVDLATTCGADIPYMCLFESRLLHFSFSSLSNKCMRSW